MGKRRPKQVNHVVPVQLGGEPRYVRRPAALKVIPDGWEPKPGVPKTRADCPKERPCVFIRCRYHLWLKLSQDREGRPRDGRRAPSVLHPPSYTSCALDVADKGDTLTMGELGVLIGTCDEGARKVLKRALAKVSALGVELEQFLEAERSLREERSGVTAIPRLP